MSPLTLLAAPLLFIACQAYAQSSGSAGGEAGAIATLLTFMPMILLVGGIYFFYRLSLSRQAAREAAGQQTGVASAPRSITGWSWAAFLLPPIWAIRNRVWIGLLTLLPLPAAFAHASGWITQRDVEYSWIIAFGFVICIAIKGRELSWKTGIWDSEERFMASQKTWDKVSVFLVIVPISILILLYVLYPELGKTQHVSSTSSQVQQPVATPAIPAPAAPQASASMLSPATAEPPATATSALPARAASQATPGTTADGQAHYRAIYAAHPDADEIMDSNSFLYWVAKTKEAEDILYQGTEKEVIHMFNEYKKWRDAQR